MQHCSSKGGNITVGKKQSTIQNSSQLISQVIKSAGSTPQWQSIKMGINDLTWTYSTDVITALHDILGYSAPCVPSKPNLATINVMPDYSNWLTENSYKTVVVGEVWTSEKVHAGDIIQTPRENAKVHVIADFPFHIVHITSVFILRQQFDMLVMYLQQVKLED